MPYKNPKDRRAYQRENWRKYQPPLVNRRETLKRRRNKKQLWLKTFKTGLRCLRCGESHPACLHFHHRDPSLKTDHIQTMICSGYSIERILLEIKKCDVLCANCHSKLHFLWSNPQFSLFSPATDLSSWLLHTNLQHSLPNGSAYHHNSWMNCYPSSVGRRLRLRRRLGRARTR